MRRDVGKHQVSAILTPTVKQYRTSRQTLRYASSRVSYQEHYAVEPREVQLAHVLFRVSLIEQIEAQWAQLSQPQPTSDPDCGTACRGYQSGTLAVDVILDILAEIDGAFLLKLRILAYHAGRLLSLCDVLVSL